MSGMEKRKSHANEASIKILNTEENFTGFDIDDNILLTFIKTKQNKINNILSVEKASSPKSYHSIGVKRAKKYHIQSEAIESVDAANVQPSLDGVGKDWKNINNCATSKSVPSKAADDVETYTSSNERRDSEMNGALREYSNVNTTKKTSDYMVKAMRHVFKNLKTHELLLASQVCSTWNITAMNRSLWRTIRLNNSMVCDWDKCIDVIHGEGSVSLDMRRMLIPSKIEDFYKFWWEFSVALGKAQQLKCLELYRCPASVVENTIFSLPQLRVLNATSVTNRPNLSEEMKNANQLMTLNLHYLDQMTNLTEIRVKGLIGIKLTCLPSFETLVNLKSLSLTSIIAFPKDICRTLETLSTSLKFFEIGDCDCLSEDFANVLKRLTNLTFLRLENCSGRFENFAKDVLSSIRGLDKLKVLELINIKFSNDVEYELEKCTNIKGLLIIPLYDRHCAATSCRLIDCLKKLKNTLSHLVWGITEEIIRCTDLLITLYQPNQHTIGYDLRSSVVRRAENNIPILRARKPRQRRGKESDNFLIISVPDLKKTLETLMINGKSKVLKIPFATTTRVYLLEHFNHV